MLTVLRCVPLKFTAGSGIPSIFTGEIKKKVLLIQSCLLLCNPMTVAHQAPMPMEFSRQELGVGCRFFLQGIFPTQGLNLGLLHCREILYNLSHHLNIHGPPAKQEALLGSGNKT